MYTKILKIRVSEELSKKTKKKAKENELSISAFVRMLLKNNT